MHIYSTAGCPKKHDNQEIVFKMFFFHKFLSCLTPKRKLKILDVSYIVVNRDQSKIISQIRDLFNEINQKKSFISNTGYGRRLSIFKVVNLLLQKDSVERTLIIFLNLWKTTFEYIFIYLYLVPLQGSRIVEEQAPVSIACFTPAHILGYILKYVFISCNMFYQYNISAVVMICYITNIICIRIYLVICFISIISCHHDLLYY